MLQLCRFKPTSHSHIDAVSINEGVYTLHDLCKLESPGFDLNLLRKVRGLVLEIKILILLSLVFR